MKMNYITATGADWVIADPHARRFFVELTCKNCGNVGETPVCYDHPEIDGVTEINEGYSCDNWRPRQPKQEGLFEG